MYYLENSGAVPRVIVYYRNIFSVCFQARDFQKLPIMVLKVAGQILLFILNSIFVNFAAKGRL